MTIRSVTPIFAKALFSTFMAIAFAYASTAFAHNKVVVVPMSGDDLKPLHNVISVAKQNGDFEDPLAAIASISDATALNPYLVVIAPGNYSLSASLIIPNYVDVVGAGRWNTILSGSISSIDLNSNAALVVANHNVSVSHLSVKNSGASGDYSVGLYSNANKPRFDSLFVSTSGGSTSIGILTEATSSAEVSHRDRKSVV